MFIKRLGQTRLPFGYKTQTNITFIVSLYYNQYNNKMNSKVRNYTIAPTSVLRNRFQIVAIFLLSCVAVSKAGLVAVKTVEVLQGPSSKTTIVGPDGAQISSVAPGGSVVIDGSGLAAAPAVLASSPAVIVGGGPAGSIITSYTAAGPAVVAAAPIVAPLAPTLIAGLSADQEGKYIPDNTEQLYDDGSYRGE